MTYFKPALIFTDLDGTLLDHETYGFNAAKPVLDALFTRGTPVMPVTSKTFNEVVMLRDKLGLRTPFAVENGAAVYIPQSYFSCPPDDVEQVHGYLRKQFGPSLSELSLVYAALPPKLRARITPFSKLGVNGVIQATGLSPNDARLALKREFSDPALWHGTDIELVELKDVLSKFGFEAVLGGRFVHITNGYSKGLAMDWLIEQFKKEQQVDTLLTVALGDSENDRSMLERADQAIVIQNELGSALTLPVNKGVITSERPGPEGWADTVGRYFKLDTKNK